MSYAGSMLLTITTTHQPATDLGYLVYKHPDRVQAFSLAFGKAHVFYPEACAERCTVALLLDIDPIGLVRGRHSQAGSDGGLLTQYVNDRPYVASSFLSVAIARVFRSALSGGPNSVCPELAKLPLPFVVRIAPLACRGGAVLLKRLFTPLGYSVQATGQPLDPHQPEWGESPYFSVSLEGRQTISQLLSHLYVLIPVLDNEKHYWVGEEELNKLLRYGEAWLAQHPEKELISRRYLKYQARLAREALRRLSDEDDLDPETTQHQHAEAEAALEQPQRLNDIRLDAVVQVIRDCGARRVLDLGCGEGRLLQKLLREKQIEEVVGLDASVRALEIAAERLKLDRMSARQRARIELRHGALTYRDERLAGYDAAVVVEVIEHLDPARLAAFEHVVFRYARPQTVIITTPNREYNGKFPGLAEGALRHRDHRFEWTRDEFTAWANQLAEMYGYQVRFGAIGEDDPRLGPPTQMGVFERCR